MGNHVSSNTVKVILLNGTVQEFQNPVTAAEVMLEHPQQMVVEALPIPRRRPVALPADKKLHTNTVYLMITRGKPAPLTSQESRRLLLTANKLLRSTKLMPLPVLAKMCESTVDHGQTIVVKQRNMQPEMLLPEYLSRQVMSGKQGWKPCLDTIKERKLEQKYSHWLFRL